MIISLFFTPSTQDIIEFRQSKMTSKEATEFLDKLEAERWLEVSYLDDDSISYAMLIFTYFNCK